jgi:tRNA guanosine-2'-O-methyltransferase
MRRSGEEILQRLKDATNGNAIPRYVVSLLKIGLMTAPYTSNVGLFTSSEFPAQFTAMVTALCAHDKVAIRFEALWTFPRLIDIAHQFQLLQSETDLESRSEWEKIYNNPAYSHLNGVIRSLAKYKNPPTTRALEKFDPSNDQNLGMLFEGGYLQLDTSGAVDNCTVAVEHFEMIYRKDEEVMETRALDRPDLNMARGRSQPKPSQHIQKKPKKCAPGSATTTPQVFQSKSLTLVEKKTQAIKAAEMILIATFVDSPYNLGGLSRVAEIFGCSALHISDLGVLKDSAFTSVSVTSESNLNIVQTPPPILKGFLRSKRAEGWTILGVEQTDSSIVLGDEKAPKLPKKVVIVMGTEKTGIPPDVLVECDSCVEIKQWGLTRSLNVQTAAAAVLYEWRREWGDGL